MKLGKLFGSVALVGMLSLVSVNAFAVPTPAHGNLGEKTGSVSCALIARNNLVKTGLQPKAAEGTTRRPPSANSAISIE
jgi:hypothetical protein